MLSYEDAAVTPAEAAAYVAARALSGWPAEEPAQIAALRRGQDYIAREFNQRWADEWVNDSAPTLVKYAIIEAARVEGLAPGSLAPVVKAADAKVLTGVGSITWTPLPGGGGVDSLKPRLTHVEAMLRPILTAGSNTIVRA